MIEEGLEEEIDVHEFPIGGDLEEINRSDLTKYYLGCDRTPYIPIHQSTDYQGRDAFRYLFFPKLMPRLLLNKYTVEDIEWATFDK